MKKSLISLVVAFGLVAPFFALAQSSTGVLTVYVQVLNQYGTTISPGSITVAVSGQSPSPASFAGSQSGTIVSLNPGSYNVTVVTNPFNFAPTYSSGCNNTIAAGQTQTCVITLSTSSTYPYPGQGTLTCSPQTQTVALGQVANFYATGGLGSYDWRTADRTFTNIGPNLATGLQTVGRQTVVVTSGGMSAACTVDVGQGYGAGYTPTTPTYPNYTYPTYPTVTSSYYPTYPKFPNSGFGPKDSAMAAAFAAVLLIAAGFVVAPYVRKTALAVIR